MKGVDILEQEFWRPLSYFGVEHSFFNINTKTVLHTWIILGALFVLLIPISWIIRKKTGIFAFLITSFVDFFIRLAKQSFDKFSMTHFTFISSLFIFISLCNTNSVIPWLEEPTRDINTTLSLSIISFLYIQFFSIKTHGFWSYAKEYFTPFFIMFPLNVIGKLASIISLAFRLFGNIFGGVLISQIYFKAIGGSLFLETLGLLSGFNFLLIIFFSLFEGLLQAFVFTMLTITYLSIGIQTEKPHVKEETA